MLVRRGACCWARRVASSASSGQRCLPGQKYIVPRVLGTSAQGTRRWYVSTARQMQAGRRYTDDDDETVMRTKDISEMRLPPNVDPDDYSYDELLALDEGYRLMEARQQPIVKRELVKVDTSHLDAVSNDPLQHHPDAPGFRMGSIYTMSEDDYNKYFPAIRWKRRLPLESLVRKALDKRYLMIRPPAVKIITHLRAFADDAKFPKMSQAEALREEWMASGQKLTLPERAVLVQEEAPPAEEGEEEGRRELAAHDEEEEEEELDEVEEEEEGEEEEEEEDDDYDLFGDEEDEERATAYEAKEEVVRRKDVDIYGTLPHLAVDANLVHKDQTYDLTLPPLPPVAKKGQNKSIFLLTGPRGQGKSASLCHVVHYCRRQGWIVLYIPSAREYVHDGEWVKPSSHFKGFFDTPDLCQLTLQHIGQAHGHQLSQLPIQDTLVLQRSGLSEGASLADLVAVGLNDNEVATSVLVDLKAEVEKQKDYPVLIAIDEYNDWFRHSDYYYADRKIEAEHLAAVRVFRDMLPHSVPDPSLRGKLMHEHVVVVAATSEHHPPNGPAKQGPDKKKKVAPLRRTGYEMMVERYSNEEFDSMYKWMAEAGLWDGMEGEVVCTEEGESDILRARMITGANPEVLEREALALQPRLFAPQNLIGKENDFAPRDVMLAEFVYNFEQGGLSMAEAMTVAPRKTEETQEKKQWR